MTINKRERKDKKERGKEIRGREIGIIRLQDRQIVTTAASTLLTGRNTEWINRACYTMNRIATDQRQTVISSNDRLRHYVPENRCRKTRDPEICAPYETRRGVIHAFHRFFPRKGNRIKRTRSTVRLELFNSRLRGIRSIDQSCRVNELGF